MPTNKKRKQYAVSIDGSTTGTGVAVFEIAKNGDYKYIEHKLFKPDKAKYTSQKKGMSKTAYKLLHAKEKREDMSNRVLFMMSHIEEMLDKYTPVVVVMEDGYGQNDMMTLKMLSRIHGDVIGWARRHGAEMVIKTPSAWRKEVGMPLRDANKKLLKREQLKELSKNIVKQVFGIDVTDDEADAICIGLSMTKILQ